MPTVQDLRRAAAGSGIPSYWTLSKADLVASLLGVGRVAPVSEGFAVREGFARSAADPIRADVATVAQPASGRAGPVPDPGVGWAGAGIQTVQAGGAQGEVFRLEGSLMFERGDTRGMARLGDLMASLKQGGARALLVATGPGGIAYDVPDPVVKEGWRAVQFWLDDLFGGDDYYVECAEGFYVGDE